MNFKEHGQFEVKVEGKLLLIDATGPFNEELLIQYESSLESCIERLEVSPWSQVVTFHQLSLFTPEAEQLLINTVINRRLRGLVACAIVLADVEGASLIKAQMSRCYTCAGVKHIFITSIQDANKWLAAV